MTATTSGFLAPQLAPQRWQVQLAAQRAMHLPPLQSMAEGEGDWPSDSAEDAAPDVIDVPRVEDRESLKKELLLAVSRTARGQQLDKRPNEAVNDVARRLEAQGAPTDAQLLNGRWNLAYCSTYLFGQPVLACVEIKFYGAFVLNRRVVSTPSTRRLLDDVAPVPHRDRARTTASSPANL